MLRLRPSVETAVLDRVLEVAETHADAPDLLRAELAQIVVAPAFGADGPSIAGDVGQWFDVEHLLRPEGRRELRALGRALMEGALPAVRAVEPYLPPEVPDAEVQIAVHLVPGFHRCYGSAAGTQIFGLRPGACADEAVLFLAHVYYHEVSERFYTLASRAAEEHRREASDLRHWIQLLVQNEGLANYAVLERLQRIRGDLPRPAYFTYAPQIGDPEATARAMKILHQALVAIDDGNWRELEPRIVAFLKDPRLPVINLAGLHMARVIADHHGESTLVAALREPQEFFALYAETGDPFLPASADWGA